MPDTPMPAMWPTLDVDSNVMDRLRTLWRLASTDDQRWELERLGTDIEAGLAEAIRYGRGHG